MSIRRCQFCEKWDGWRLTDHSTGQCHVQHISVETGSQHWCDQFQMSTAVLRRVLSRDIQKEDQLRLKGENG